MISGKENSFFSGDKWNPVVRKVNPVDRVWVLNPSHSSEDIVDKKNEGIKFVQLIPGKDHGSVIRELLEEIDTALDGALIWHLG